MLLRRLLLVVFGFGLLCGPANAKDLTPEVVAKCKHATALRFLEHEARATAETDVRGNTHKQWHDGDEVLDATIEVPVTIRNPDKRIGTHVFTAMARNDASLRWTAVTIDNGDDAKDALDRIPIPQDVLDRIAPTALPRSSIVISDE